SVTTATFELRDSANALVPATVSYNSASKTATLQPSAALASSGTFTARVIGGSAGGKDLAGNALRATVTATVPGADTSAPTVTSLTPANGATNVSAGTAVVAVFGEAVDASTITAATFELRDAANALITATVSYDSASKTATLQPSASLASSGTFTA